MAVKRVLLFGASIVFGAVLSAYLFVHSTWQTYAQRFSGLAVSNQCDDDVIKSGQRQNPNKMLFISCGGFID